MDEQRIRQVKQAMAKENLDVLVCRLPENIVFLSGHWPMTGFSFLIYPFEGKPVYIVPRSEEKEAESELWDADCVSFPYAVLEAKNPYEETAKALKAASSGKNWKHVGFEGNFESVAPPWNTAEPAISAATTYKMLGNVFGSKNLMDSTDFLHSQRACKTPIEIEKFRIVNEIAAFGLQAFFEKVKPGISGVELVAEVEQSITKQGAGYKGVKRVRAFAQVSTGAAETSLGYRPILISTKRKLMPGDLALLELAVVADGFWSDRTRVRSAGEPSKEQLHIFGIIKTAQESAIKTIRAGVTAGEVDKAARSVINEAGFEKEFLHVTGHGLGFRYHEPVPLICPGSGLVLQTGMLHTVEPGIYIPGTIGIRIEDNVIVTENSSEVLGPFSKGII